MATQLVRHGKLTHPVYIDDREHGFDKSMQTRKSVTYSYIKNRHTNRVAVAVRVAADSATRVDLFRISDGL